MRCGKRTHFEDTNGDEQTEDGALALRSCGARGERKCKLLLSLRIIAVAERSGGIQTIPGETGHEEVYDVYRVDDAALYKMVLELFYTQTEDR